MEQSRTTTEPVEYFRHDNLNLTPHASAIRTSRVVTTLLEDLGYRLGRESDGALANSVFILATEVQHRLARVVDAIEASENRSSD